MGYPSKGTSKDRRLKVNSNVPPTMDYYLSRYNSATNRSSCGCNRVGQKWLGQGKAVDRKWLSRI